MGFIKGALVAIPIGLYFGERNLGFPLRFRVDRYRQEIELVFEYRFMNAMIEDLRKLTGDRR